MLIQEERKITKEQYDRARQASGYLTESDKEQVFSQSELLGYGVYSPIVFESGGEYYVSYRIGDSCD